MLRFSAFNYQLFFQCNFTTMNSIFQALICLVDKKTGEKSKTRPRFVKQDQVAIMRIECAGVICLEVFKLFPQMGRFTLRDESEYICCYDYQLNCIRIIKLLHKIHTYCFHCSARS